VQFIPKPAIPKLKILTVFKVPGIKLFEIYCLIGSGFAIFEAPGIKYKICFVQGLKINERCNQLLYSDTWKAVKINL